MKVRRTFIVASLLLAALPALGQIPNTVSAQEKAVRWQLLFDGRTSAGWRSVRFSGFPSNGWKIKDGLLSVTERGGEEGGNAGDIITIVQVR
jgi:hypothetical protein